MNNLTERDEMSNKFYEDLKLFRKKYPLFVIYPIYPEDFERFADKELTDNQIKNLCDAYHNGEGLTIVVNELLYCLNH